MLSASPHQKMREGNRSFYLGTIPETVLQQLVEADSPAGLAPPTQEAGRQGRAHLGAPPMNAHQPEAIRQTK